VRTTDASKVGLGLPIQVDPGDQQNIERGGTSPPTRLGDWITKYSVWLMLALGAFLCAAYWRTLADTFKFLMTSDDMAHGFFAPVVAAFIAWQKRAIVFSERGSPYGFLALLIGAFLGTAAALGGSTTVSRLAFLFSLTGCLILLGGVYAFRVLIFPLSLLLFTFPIPQVLYAEITLPLQLLATHLSASALGFFGFSVVQSGNILELPHVQLSIVEACSGLRSLVTLGFFCLSFAYLFERNNWVRAAIVASAIPAAILLNAARITATGILSEKAPELTHGIFHSILGWTCLAIAFIIILYVDKATKNVYKRLST
jgi:exosortase